MAIQQRASGVFARVQRLIDRMVSPDTRNQFYSNIREFSNEQPLLASFLAIQILLSTTPLLLFGSFVVGTVLLSLVSAVLFSLFWIGIASLFLIPTLFVTTGVGFFVWVWAVTSFVFARWVYNVMPFGVRGTAEMKLPNGKKVVVKKDQEGVDGVKGEVLERATLDG